MRHFREKNVSIIKIQNAYRRYVCKNQYLQKIDACVKVQSMIRRYIARKQLRYVLKNAIKIQSYIRSSMEKAYVRDLRLSERLRIEEEYEKLLLLEKKRFYATNVHHVITVQTIYRGNKLRKNYLKKNIS